GEQIRPTMDDITCSLPEGSYEIIGYGPNVKPGKGTVIVQGAGQYGGTKEITFKIKNRSISNSNIE
ncbi:MAG: hypothetical protein IKT17_08395, partial [Lachnospiraceae bacterium]|nr:hypothetical protein [Lachnospiraceae bacterium]